MDDWAYLIDQGFTRSEETHNEKDQDLNVRVFRRSRPSPARLIFNNGHFEPDKPPYSGQEQIRQNQAVVLGIEDAIENEKQ